MQFDLMWQYYVSLLGLGYIFQSAENETLFFQNYWNSIKETAPFSRIYYARITMKCVPSREPCEKMPRYFAKKNAGLSHKLVKFIAQMEWILFAQRMKSVCRSPAGDELSVRTHLLPSTRDLSSSLRTEPVHTSPSWIFFIEKQKINWKRRTPPSG